MDVKDFANSINPEYRGDFNAKEVIGKIAAQELEELQKVYLSPLIDALKDNGYDVKQRVAYPKSEVIISVEKSGHVFSRIYGFDLVHLRVPVDFFIRVTLGEVKKEFGERRNTSDTKDISHLLLAELKRKQTPHSLKTEPYTVEEISKIIYRSILPKRDFDLQISREALLQFEQDMAEYLRTKKAGS